jgi:hypothetical protein
VGFLSKLVNANFGNSRGLKGLFLNEVQRLGDEQPLTTGTGINEKGIDWIMGHKPVIIQEPSIQKSNETIFDNKPTLGSVVYYQQDNIEHSGIYVGDDMFIHLNHDGKIDKVGLNDFTSKIDMVETDLWFPCNNEDGHALGLCTAVYIALEIIDNSENYDFNLDNSQQFISGCITNTFNNEDHSILRLKHTFASKFDCNVIWKCWER